MVIPSMITSALKNNSIKVFGDGSQSRCFCHVSDVVGALYKLISTDKTIGNVYNVGSQQEISILNLAESIKSKLEKMNIKNINIQKIPYSEAYEAGFEDMQRRMPDLTKIKAAIGFNPAKNLDNILDDVITEKRERLDCILII
jgi:UDP-glucose 4-epimerase